MIRSGFWGVGVLVLMVCVGALHARPAFYNHTFPLSDVKINAGPFRQALQLNVEVLLKYDADRLLAPFLREAGLTPKKAPYGNWESDGLDGHIGGHYLTALALHYAASGNEACKSRLDYMVSELRRCQEASKNGKGYIGGVPVSGTFNGRSINLWDEIRSGNTAVI